MKLHLPHKLRHSLLVCICSAAAFGSTLSTGALLGGAFVATIAGQVMADELTGGQTYESISAGTYTTTGTGDVTIGAIYVNNGNVSISATVEAPVKGEFGTFNNSNTGSAGSFVTSALTLGNNVTLTLTDGINMSSGSITLNSGSNVTAQNIYMCSDGKASSLTVSGGNLVAVGETTIRDATGTISVSDQGGLTTWTLNANSALDLDISGGSTVQVKGHTNLNHADSVITVSGDGSRFIVGEGIENKDGNSPKLELVDGGALGATVWGLGVNAEMVVKGTGGTIDTRRYVVSTLEYVSGDSANTVLYNINKDVTVEAGSTLIVAGAGTVNFGGASDGDATDVVHNSGTISITGASAVKFENLAFEAAGAALDIQAAANVKIGALTVNFNYFTDNSAGVFSDGRDGILSNYVLIDGSKAGSLEVTPNKISIAGFEHDLTTSGKKTTISGGYYFVNTADATYAKVAATEQVNHIVMNGGTLTADAGATISQDVTVISNSIITAGGSSSATLSADEPDTKALTVVGGSSAEAPLTFFKALNAGSLTASGYVILAGDACIGAETTSGSTDYKGNITVSAGGYLQYGDAYTAANQLGFQKLTVEQGATFAVYHAPSEKASTYLKGGTNDVELMGGNFKVLGQEGGTVAAGALRFDSLTITRTTGEGGAEVASCVLSESNAPIAYFDVLTGAGTLNATVDSGSTLGFEKIEDYDGTLAKSGDGELYINSISQAEGKHVSVTGETHSKSATVDFVKSGKGSASLESHTAASAFKLEAGTLTVGKLTLADGASLSLTGGIFGVGKELETGVDTTLGNVTLGATGYNGAITLDGAVTFIGAVTNTVTLNLTGSVVVTAEALNSILTTTSSSGTGTTYTNIEGQTAANGYVSATYNLITGGTISFGEGVTEKDVTIAGSAGKLTLGSGQNTASFEVAQSSGLYYITGADARYESAEMANATAFYVTNGKTFTLDSAGVILPVTLSNGTLAMQGQHIGTADSAVSISLTGGLNTISNTGSDTVNMYATVSGRGNLELVGDIAVHGSASLNNTGVVTLNGSGMSDGLGLDYSMIGVRVTAVELKNANLSVASADIFDDLISTAVSGTCANKVSITSTAENGNDMTSAISGNAGLTVELKEGTQLRFYGSTTGLSAGDLTFSGSGEIHLGGVNGDIGQNPMLNHAGDLIINGVTATLGNDSGWESPDPATIANTGNLVIGSGSLSVDGDAETSSGGSVINLAGTANGKGRILISGGSLTVGTNAGLIAARGLEMTSGNLVLGKDITLTGGATDANGKAVDALVLSGGTVTAAANVALGCNATLGGVTIGSGAGTLTIGAAGTTTTFAGAVTNGGNLALLGTLSLADGALSSLASAVVTAAPESGVSGEESVSYTLITGAGGSLSLADGVQVNVSPGVSATLTAGDGGSGSFTINTYHVASDSTADKATAYASLSTANKISLDGGVLKVGYDRTSQELVDKHIAVTADSVIYGQARMSGHRAGIAGGITAAGTGGDLTIMSGAKSASTDGEHGDFFSLSGDINLGSHKLIIGEGVVRLGNINQDTASDNYALNVGGVEVNSGATLEIYRDGGTIDAGVTLKGNAVLRIQQVNAAGGQDLNLGTLTVSKNGDEVAQLNRNSWGYDANFSSLTGDGNLQILGGGDCTTDFGSVTNYTGQLEITGGTVNVKSSIALSNNVTLSGGTMNVEGDINIAGGKFSLKSGNASKVLSSTGYVKVSGTGALDIQSDATVTSTIKAQTVTGTGDAATVSDNAVFTAREDSSGKKNTDAFWYYKDVTITASSLSSTWSDAYVNSVDIDVKSDYELSGGSGSNSLIIKNCTFDLDAALTVGNSTTIDAASTVNIGTTGALVNVGDAELALGGANTLWLDTDASNGSAYIEFNNATLTLTSTQLQGNISGTFVLEASSALLDVLENKKTITLIFNTAGSSSAQALQAALAENGALPASVLTANTPVAADITLANEETPAAGGLVFTLGSSLAEGGYTLTQTAEGSYTLSSSDAIPEPATATLSLLALAALAARRRRK